MVRPCLCYCCLSLWWFLPMLPWCPALPVAASTEATAETLFRHTVQEWNLSPTDWNPWIQLAQELWNRFNTDPDATGSRQPLERRRLEVVGALEESILFIERLIVQYDKGDDRIRDGALSILYTMYAQTLRHVSAAECLALARDPHTLLIGIEALVPSPSSSSTTTSNRLCLENAENAVRNAISLDATNTDAAMILHMLTGEDTAHKRKPKEFVAELFDSFADSFDDKLLKNLQYKVPSLIGIVAQSLSSQYHAILDAGCGTGLAGRFLRPLVIPQQGIMVGVDASSKMLQKAAQCTRSFGCGHAESSTVPSPRLDDSDRAPLYDALLNMDLEEMTINNVLFQAIPTTPVQAFDLIVAADVLVYFGNLESILAKFASLSLPHAFLVFTCEKADPSEAPLGWRLLPTGRFSHTKDHVTTVATLAGYDLVQYEEIIPRTEKGEPVQGHLFAFQYTMTKTTDNSDHEDL